MAKIKIFARVLLFMTISTLVVFGFQNCAPSAKNQSQVNLACSGGTCVESSSSASQTPPSSSSGTSPSGMSATLYNIVSGVSKADCEFAIASNYKKQISCTMGGGCGVSCGKPSSSCPSANPNHYGVCLTKEELDSAPAVTSSGSGSGSASTPSSSTMYNFAAGDKASCEASIVSRLGVKSISCRVGGGCGVSCGKPTSKCESANPDVFGACVDSQDIEDAKRVDAADKVVQSLYNVVAGDQATCEASLRNNFAINASCKVGAGCGVSCGKPGAGCASANPSVPGVCISTVDIELIKKAAMNQYYNFVAGDKATCEASIKSRLNIRAACTMGGGCGVSCGMPGAFCTSANPNAYGACIRM